MVIVDSSVWIDALRGRQSAPVRWLRNAILQNEELGLTSLILCEVLQGVRSEKQFRDFKDDLLRFPIYDCASTELAVAASCNYMTLRNKGITIRKTIDCLIATFCIARGFALLHADRDFDPFASHLGLKILDPLVEAINWKRTSSPS